ncbi:DNA polymerase III subunit delta' [Pigmentiphaga litoralis]|uniref:DNA polymerase-3 subunit delta n=1 Tax=Pigmentiphaga litoralis TaxID=516702 RepID=A0A7Y9IW36_9BURK|nr:DNA polymerase III subunit delta' [Pigmentiphaga litoralis]NYE22525.1 DNA polymerase-3 subunit delta' [Pigmentiphaga litoralis]NYE83860.1 DNA polymerase-3 subunit delta' [Pigmentiphaga litoralis]
MSVPQFYPWQVETAREWLGAQQRERFAHAWLIHGLAGIGKVEFARAAAAALLCESPQGGLACGVCSACTWYGSGNHPDFRRIRPEAVALAEGVLEDALDGDMDEPAEAGKAASKRAPSKEIRIEQIRSMESWVNTGTHRGGLRVVVLYPAETLNTISANGLLKVLEEPPPHTVFLLVSDAPDRLLPTLVSRCRRLPLATPPADVALPWLEARGVKDAAAQLAAVGGAPVAAARRIEADIPVRADWLETLAQALARGQAPDAGALVDTLDKVPATEWIDALQRWCTDLALLQAGVPVRYFPSLADPLGKVAARASRHAVADMARWLTRQRRIAAHPLNAKLFAHDAMLRVTAACLKAA